MSHYQPLGLLFLACGGTIFFLIAQLRLRAQRDAESRLHAELRDLVGPGGVYVIQLCAIVLGSILGAAAVALGFFFLHGVAS
jgi:hypothetical protein